MKLLIEIDLDNEASSEFMESEVTRLLGQLVDKTDKMEPLKALHIGQYFSLFRDGKICGTVKLVEGDTGWFGLQSAKCPFCGLEDFTLPGLKHHILTDHKEHAPFTKVTP